MEPVQKLNLLGEAAQDEVAEDVDLQGRRRNGCRTPRDLVKCVSHAVMPNGQRIPLLKTLVSSVCENDCRYCAFRSGRDVRRATFTPDELARLSDQLWRQGIVKGVFLSSGLVGGGPKTQDRIIATAELLRRKYRFTGYLHVKIMPGSEFDQVVETVRWADRVSVNLEAPSANRLSELAPNKQFSDQLLAQLRWASRLKLVTPEKRRSMTTQFVVGPAGESDLELLLTSSYLYSELGLARAYFSAFRPVPDTPLEEQAAEDHKREHRLYQASFLLRDYGFDAEELPYGKAGDLPRDIDPKLAWAKRHLCERPIEVNTADRRSLLRIPGIGPKSAERILVARRRGRLSDLSHLRQLGIRAGRAAPYVLLDGRQAPRQLSLWPVAG